jgi:prepilin-type N-terminal cleavage/methylation domain-containing protein
MDEMRKEIGKRPAYAKAAVDRRRTGRGMTLVELLVAVAAISLMSAFAASRLLDRLAVREKLENQVVVKVRRATLAVQGESAARVASEGVDEAVMR